MLSVCRCQISVSFFVNAVHRELTGYPFAAGFGEKHHVIQPFLVALVHVAKELSIQIFSYAGFSLVDFVTDVFGQKGKHPLPILAVEALIVLLCDV